MPRNYSIQLAKGLFFTFFFLFLANTVLGQSGIRLLVKDAKTGEALPGATITAKTQKHIAAATAADGSAIIKLNTADTLVITYSGYRTATLAITLPDNTLHTILLEADERALNEVTIVASTRNNDRIENATTKVEVLGQEEMNEESTLKPGNVASILGDISGVQIQQSSAVSGNTNVRIQGLDGRYTQLLRDGMPVFEGFSGGFGVLSIPPLDLRQLELIKGSASTLYGGGAIAGLVNFISKKPSFHPDASFVLNGTTLKELNLNAYYAQRWKSAGFTFFAGRTQQREVDADKDGLSDVSRNISTLVHPTLFIYPSNKSSIALGWAGSFENRTGGDMEAIDGRASVTHPYYERNKLTRNTFTLIAEDKLGDRLTGTVKGTFSNFNRQINTNTYYFTGRQQNYYAEASLMAALQRHTLVGGTNFTGDSFKPIDGPPILLGQIINNTIGFFVQDTWQMSPTLKAEMGIRADHHNQYGWFILPRLALFQHINEHWGLRGGIGAGYKTPNPLTPQIKDYDIGNIHPTPAGAIAEHSFGANIEGNYRYSWGEDNSIFINHAFFLTQLNHPFVGAEQPDGSLSFFTGSKPVITKGFDTYVQLKADEWEAYIGYTYTQANRTYLATNSFMPLTPRNRAAATLVYDIEGQWRFGLEGSYNGMQYRDNDIKTPHYFFVAAMLERKFGPRFSLVLNCENLLNVRQSNYERIYTGPVTAPVYKPLWAPIDGRAINLALRFQPFAE